MDFFHLYSTRTRKSVDEDLVEIIDTFHGLLNSRKSGVKLVNYYKGLPLCYSASIEGVDRGMLDLEVHPNQAVAIERERYTFIICDAFPHAIGAHVQYINVGKRAVTLTRLFYAHIMAELRHSIRLMLDPASDATIESPEISISGTLYDLSAGGAAIRIEHPFSIPDGTDLILKFMLPNIIQNTHTAVTTAARYVGTLELEGSFLARFAISPDKQVEQQIAKYIFQRQVEIIRSLKEAQ